MVMKSFRIFHVFTRFYDTTTGKPATGSLGGLFMSTTTQQHSSNTVITITLSAHIHGGDIGLAKVFRRGALVVCFAGNGTCLLPVVTWFPVHSPGGKYTLLRTLSGCQHHRMRNIQYRSNMRSGTKVPFPE